MQETQYYDGKKTKESFDNLRDLLDSVAEKVGLPNVKKIIITFPKLKIPSKRNAK